jgi:hypothetical protein
MSIISHTWELVQKETVRTETKHCKMCGKNSIFTDTNIRRHNSNGKYIYRFAIYKCEQNHTWNKKLSIYKTYNEHARVDGKPHVAQETSLTEIPVYLYASQGKSEIHIIINGVTGNFRIDRILADQIPDWSRVKITDKIRDGSILVNGKMVKPSAKLMDNDVIIIKLEEYNP